MILVFADCKHACSFVFLVDPSVLLRKSYARWIFDIRARKYTSLPLSFSLMCRFIAKERLHKVILKFAHCIHACSFVFLIGLSVLLRRRSSARWIFDIRACKYTSFPLSSSLTCQFYSEIDVLQGDSGNRALYTCVLICVCRLYCEEEDPQGEV